MTSVAKTNQNVKFDPTNYNKMFENANSNSKDLINNVDKNSSKESRPILFDSNYLDNTSEYDIYSVKRNFNMRNYNWNSHSINYPNILYISIIFIVFGIFLLIFSKFIR